MTYYVLVSNYNENVKVNDLCQRYGGINMAKKVRFPLEMEDGVEVRSMEELRDNFSLSRVLGYFNDGRLVTWLQDRYENTIAEEIAAINPNEEDVEKKICEVLDVKYDENTSEEEGKAEERKRKLELLKEYPDCMKYAKNVDYVAFDQDDLYDLLDEDVKKIYLCGKRFSVPISKGNTKYIGIIDGVEVVIEAKQPVDFESKSISFVNCQFDEKYRKIVGAEEKNLLVIAENKENKADSKFDIFNDIFDSESECQEKSNDSQALSNIDLDEISEFVDNISEILEEFVDEAFENEEEGLYDYDGSIECEADDYNDSGYYIKAKAKAACKEELSRAVSEVKGLYENVKKELIDTTEICYKELTFSIAAFLKNVFFESCEAFADVCCTGNTKRYVERKIDDLKTSVNKPDESWEEQIQKKCQKAFAEAIEKSFDEEEKEVPGIKELFEKCEYCEEYEDDYSFYIDSACESLVDAYESIIYDAEADFPNAVYESYVEVMYEYVNNLKEWIGSFQNRKTVTGREMIERIIKRLNM